MDLLVTYDISTVTREGERRLTRVAAVCERYGARVQFSVFECRLSHTVFELFVGELRDVLVASEDSVNIYHFDRSIDVARTCLGLQAGSRGGAWLIKSPRRTSDP